MSSESQLKRRQDAARLKELLLQLHKPVHPFTLNLTNRVYPGLLGTYAPGRRHICVHGGRGDFRLWLKVAIHEYAHHIHFTENGLRRLDREDHGKTFQRLNNALLALAHKKGLFGRSSLFNPDSPT